MLRITIDEGKEAVVVRLEGQLIGPRVEEVEQCWRKAFATLGSRTVQGDLSAVNFVDASGGALLIRCTRPVSDWPAIAQRPATCWTRRRTGLFGERTELVGIG